MHQLRQLSFFAGTTYHIAKEIMSLLSFMQHRHDNNNGSLCRKISCRTISLISQLHLYTMKKPLPLDQTGFHKLIANTLWTSHDLTNAPQEHQFLRQNLGGQFWGILIIMVTRLFMSDHNTLWLRLCWQSDTIDQFILMQDLRLPKIKHTWTPIQWLYISPFSIYICTIGIWIEPRKNLKGTILKLFYRTLQIWGKIKLQNQVSVQNIVLLVIVYYNQNMGDNMRI